MAGNDEATGCPMPVCRGVQGQDRLKQVATCASDVNVWEPCGRLERAKSQWRWCDTEETFTTGYLGAVFSSRLDDISVSRNPEKPTPTSWLAQLCRNHKNDVDHQPDSDALKRQSATATPLGGSTDDGFPMKSMTTPSRVRGTAPCTVGFGWL